MVSRLSEGELDVLGFLTRPNRVILTVECSTASLHSKISKVEEKAAVLRDVLPDWEIIPLVFVQRGTMEKTLHSGGVISLGILQMDEILRLAQEESGTEHILNYIRKLREPSQDSL